MSDESGENSDPASAPRQSGADVIGAVYDELRKLAKQRMLDERVEHTLQPTALVHEAFMRLEKAGLLFESPTHYYRVAAEAMRRILIEYARAKKADKRGGGQPTVPIDLLDVIETRDPNEILAFDDAIQRLEEETPFAASVVRLRFYAGLSIDETAKTLGVGSRTVDREWSYARAWLYRELYETR